MIVFVQSGPAPRGEARDHRLNVGVGIMVALLAMAVTYALHAHAAWLYPRWSDQVQYLHEAYAAYQVLEELGVSAGVMAALAQQSPQGALHDVLALLPMAWLGPGRMAALSLHIGWLILLAWMLGSTIRRLWPGRGLEVVALGLLASLPVLWSGGTATIVDYRLEWPAVCAYGVAVLALVRTNGLQVRRWVVGFGLACGVAILTRFLTAAYIIIWFVLLLLLTIGLPGRKRCWLNLGLAAGVTALVGGPFLWVARREILNYYWWGHVSGPERALRAHDETGGWETSLWLGRELVGTHFGLLFLGLAGVIALALVVLGRRGGPAHLDHPAGSRWPALAAATGVGAPLVVLGMHTVKATAPLSIVAVPGLVLVLAALAYLAYRIASPALARRALIAMGFVAFLVGLLKLPKIGVAAGRAAGDSAQVAALTDYVTYRVQQSRGARYRVAVLGIVDGITAPALNVFGYERHRSWPGLEQTLPTGLFEPEPGAMERQLAGSDFVLWPRTALSSTWPFDRHVEEHRERYEQWCEQHLQWITDLWFQGTRFALYERLASPEVEESRSLFARVQEAVARKPRAALAEAIEPPDWQDDAELLLLWPKGTPFSFQPRFGSTPVELHVVDGVLPPGVALRSRSRLFGTPKVSGRFPIVLLASNAAGETPVGVTLEVVDDELAYRFLAPTLLAPAEPWTVRFQLFDARGQLHFIDFSDLTTGEMLGRVTPGRHQVVRWVGTFQCPLRGTGRHRINVRMVRYDGDYSFVDHVLEVDVDETKVTRENGAFRQAERDGLTTGSGRAAD